MRVSVENTKGFPGEVGFLTTLHAQISLYVHFPFGIQNSISIKVPEMSFSANFASIYIALIFVERLFHHFWERERKHVVWLPYVTPSYLASFNV